MLNSDDMFDVQDRILEIFDDSSCSLNDAASILGMILAKIYLVHEKDDLTPMVSFMSHFSSIVSKNETDEDTSDSTEE